MLKRGRYKVLLIAFVALAGLLLCCTEKKTKKEEAVKGPQWVKNSLIEAGVFETPTYALTNEYEQYKQYENIKGLFFDALNYHGNKTKVFCWYGVPQTLKEGEKAPAVVLVHGGGGTVFPEWVKKWTDHGYIAISLGLEGQVPGPKNQNSPLEVGHPNHTFSGPFRKGFFLDLMEEELSNQWFYHAVADAILANSLLRSFPEVDPNKIGITGISWGGILTNVITGIDERFAFAIPVYGCGFLHEAPTYIKQLKEHSAESKQFYLDNWEPSLYAPLQKQPTLFVNGTNDGHFSMNSFTKTYLVSGAEKYLCVRHEMPHGHRAGWNPEEIYQFADYVVKKGKAPIKFEIKSDNKVIAFDGAINQAVAYYTTDTADWDKKSYKWLEKKLEFSNENKKIVVDIPSNAVYYFVNGVDMAGLVYSTPMIKY